MRAALSLASLAATSVWAWRQALGVGRTDPEGTKQLYRDLMPQKIPPEVAAKGRSAALAPDVIERMAAGKRGKPAHPNTAKALHDGRHAPKPAGFGERANKWMLAGKRKDV